MPSPDYDEDQSFFVCYPQKKKREFKKCRTACSILIAGKINFFFWGKEGRVKSKKIQRISWDHMLEKKK